MEVKQASSGREKTGAARRWKREAAHATRTWSRDQSKQSAFDAPTGTDERVSGASALPTVSSFPGAGSGTEAEVAEKRETVHSLRNNPGTRNTAPQRDEPLVRPDAVGDGVDGGEEPDDAREDLEAEPVLRELQVVYVCWGRLGLASGSMV